MEDMPSATDNTSSANEKFKAALGVIEKLPKEGPAKPSHQVMLTFYGLFKQATDGPCMKPKPWAFDVVNKMKWEYWNKLGNMSKEEAMTKYVDALKKQIELIPMSEDISEFMGVLGKFYSVAGISPPKSFTDNYDFTSVKTSTSAESFSAIEEINHKADEEKENGNALVTSPITSDEEDFCDTLDVFNEVSNKNGENQNGIENKAATNESSKRDDEHAANTVVQQLTVKHDNMQKVYKQIETSLANLQRDMQALTHCVDDVANSVAKHEQWINKSRKKRLARIFPGLSNEALTLIIIWPFVAHILLRIFPRRKTLG